MLEELVKNPQNILEKRSHAFNNQDGHVSDGKLYASNKGNNILNSVPHKSFSMQNGSTDYKQLYNQYYREINELYEGNTFKTPDFESYVIESYLRRKQK